MADNSARLKTARRNSYRRETFALPREAAREKAREMFRRYPKAAYMTAIESWRELPDGDIDHHGRLPSRTDRSQILKIPARFAVRNNAFVRNSKVR